jgi:hypothetical protein
MIMNDLREKIDQVIFMDLVEKVTNDALEEIISLCMDEAIEALRKESDYGAIDEDLAIEALEQLKSTSD